MQPDRDLDEATVRKVETTLQAIVAANRHVLDDETVAFVDHYLYHAEYEMAFEGLFLALLNLHGVHLEQEPPELLSLGRVLRLDEETVYDPEFWSKFIAFLEAR